MQTGVVACAPGLAVALALTVIDDLHISARNERSTVDEAVPVSDLSAFCVKDALPVLPYLPVKSPVNTAFAVETWFAVACVTPASTAASSAFCSWVLTSLTF